jgi:hypothetical protein
MKKAYEISMRIAEPAAKAGDKKRDKKACSSMTCRHDYKNAVQIGNVDYVCPLCKRALDPLEWFLMNSFKFVDVTPEASRRSVKSHKKKDF